MFGARLLRGDLVAGLVLAAMLLPVVDPGPVRAAEYAWNSLPTRTPGPQVAAELVVWDAFGGRVLCLQDATLWALTPGSGQAWDSIAVNGTPPQLVHGACGVFDPSGNRILQFGGLRSGSAVNEVWELALGTPPTWRLLPLAAPPSPRVFASAVYDPGGHRMIVFGGGNNLGTQYNDIFALSLTPQNEAWSQLIGDGQPGSPSERERHTAIFDPVRSRMVVFGGVGPSWLTNDVWALSLSGSPAWTSLSTTGAPSPRDQHAAIYDAANDRMIVHGGFGGDVLSDAAALPFTGPAQWEALPPRVVGWGHAAVYDPTGRMLIPNSNATHALDLGLGVEQWSYFERHIRPLARPSAAIAADSRHLVVAGGGGPPRLWALDLSDPAASWAGVDASGGPENRSEMAMVWDPLRTRMLTYGGLGLGNAEFNDVWSLTLGPPAAWTPVATNGATPPPGFGWRGVYDPTGDRLVFLALDKLQPCCAPPTYYNWIFELRLSGPQAPRWTQHDVLPPSFRRRDGASFSYDATRDVAWIYGGQDSNRTRLGDVWQVSLAGTPSVTQIASSGVAPTPRAHHAAYFDDLRDRLVVFGGLSGPTDTPGVPRDDSWQLEPGAANLWTALAPDGGPPPARAFMGDAFDVAGDRLVVFGGTSSTGPPAEGLDDTWALTFTSLVGIEPGPEAGGRLRLTLRGGNPVQGEVGVAYSLPGPGGGSVDLIDVTGRLVRAVRLGDAPAGTVALARRGELRPGIYFVRLRHGLEERRLRLIVLT